MKSSASDSAPACAPASALETSKATVKRVGVGFSALPYHMFLFAAFCAKANKFHTSRQAGRVPNPLSAIILGKSHFTRSLSDRHFCTDGKFLLFSMLFAFTKSGHMLYNYLQNCIYLVGAS